MRIHSTAAAAARRLSVAATQPHEEHRNKRSLGACDRKVHGSIEPM